jgi:hypothetical protein
VLLEVLLGARPGVLLEVLLEARPGVLPEELLEGQQRASQAQGVPRYPACRPEADHR